MSPSDIQAAMAAAPELWIGAIAFTCVNVMLAVGNYFGHRNNRRRSLENIEVAKSNLRMAEQNLKYSLDWRRATDVAQLDAAQAFPIAVLVAAWHDGSASSSFVTTALYFGPGQGFILLAVGLPRSCVITHWRLAPPAPPETEMLQVSLGAAGFNVRGTQEPVRQQEGSHGR